MDPKCKITPGCIVAVVCLALSAGCSHRESSSAVTIAEPLEVVARVPSVDATDVPVDALISVTFSAELDPSSIDSNALQILGISGDICCLGRIITFRPTTCLEYSRTYTVEIDSGLSDCRGQVISENQCWQFRTIDNPYLPDFPDPPGKLSSIPCP